MDIIFYVHKSVELLFHILGLVEVWTRRSMELSPPRQDDFLLYFSILQMFPVNGSI
jgi:hypothetical protein